MRSERALPIGQEFGSGCGVSARSMRWAGAWLRPELDQGVQVLGGLAPRVPSLSSSCFHSIPVRSDVKRTCAARFPVAHGNICVTCAIRRRSGLPCILYATAWRELLVRASPRERVTFVLSSALSTRQSRDDIRREAT